MPDSTAQDLINYAASEVRLALKTLAPEHEMEERLDSLEKIKKALVSVADLTFVDGLFRPPALQCALVWANRGAHSVESLYALDQEVTEKEDNYDRWDKTSRTSASAFDNLHNNRTTDTDPSRTIRQGETNTDKSKAHRNGDSWNGNVINADIHMEKERYHGKTSVTKRRQSEMNEKAKARNVAGKARDASDSENEVEEERVEEHVNGANDQHGRDELDGEGIHPRGRDKSESVILMRSLLNESEEEAQQLPETIDSDLWVHHHLFPLSTTFHTHCSHRFSMSFRATLARKDNEIA